MQNSVIFGRSHNFTARMISFVLISTISRTSGTFPTLPYRHEGMWTGPGQLCSSPLWFNNTLYLMSSREKDESQGLNSSHFCIFDGYTGEQRSCPESSSGHFFFSAIVDHGHDIAHPTVWVFGSAWDRSHKPPDGKGWGVGPCADALNGKGGGCHVGVWKSTDLKTWTFAKAVTLPLPMTVANVGVSMIPAASRMSPAPGLPKHQAFMARD